jgi:hypothetical protein
MALERKGSGEEEEQRWWTAFVGDERRLRKRGEQDQAASTDTM